MLIPLLALFSTLSFAATPHETLYYKGYVSPDLISLWSAIPGKHSFEIEAGDGEATSEELRAIASLRGADRILLETERYPMPDMAPEWKRLASQGVELIALGRAEIPLDDEINRLNEAGFSRCLIVLGFYPGLEEARRLGRLQCKLSLTFAVSAYPRFEDKEGLQALAPDVPLMIATDYWPWHSHMDTLNLVPQRKRLRVRGMLPPEDSLPYLRNIKQLDDIQLSLESDPEDWSAFDGLPLTWISQGHVPSEAALASFARSATRGPRKLLIDGDNPWTSAERARIEHSPLAVEWIHAAPGAWSRTR